MTSIGELVSEAVDLNERALSEKAFVASCNALRQTLVKHAGKEDPGLVDLKAFIDEHWELIFFMSFPSASSPFLDVKFVIKEISLNPRRKYTIKELVVYLVSSTLRSGRLPEDIGLTGSNDFEKKDGKLLVPVTLTSGLLAFTVVHPANKNEAIADKYWVSIADFKMFVSELWGRIDLAERVRRFYHR